LIPSARSVAIEVAPYENNLISYERARIAPLIVEAQHTTEWLSPFMLTPHQDLKAIHLEALWSILIHPLHSRWPETLRLEKPALIDLGARVTLVVQFAVAFQVVSALQPGNPRITLRSFAATFERTTAYSEAHLDQWLAERQVSASKRAYLLPLVRAKQNPAHPAFVAVQRLLFGHLAQENHQPDSVWSAYGVQGAQTKDAVLALAYSNYTIHFERYVQIAQAH
jgi:hypothetical protein